jgi:hypothetical protein
MAVVKRPGLVTSLVVASMLLVSCQPAAGPNPGASTAQSPNSISTASWLTADRDGVHFRYPAGWYENHDSIPGTFGTLVVSVSNQPLHDPCVVTGPSGGAVSGVRCGAPLDQLRARGILAEWSATSFPNWRFDDQAGRPLVVDSRRAKIKEGPIVTIASCDQLRADDGVSVVIEQAIGPDSFYGFTACMRGPDVIRERATVMAILNSVHFT